MGNLGAARYMLPRQATLLPSVFSTMTNHDLTWNMDTGIIIVRLIRCIWFLREGFLDLSYPPQIPSTWHQRLGHPSEEVSRSLVSHDFISCNKDKPLHICHAFQLGKHCDHDGEFDNTNLLNLFTENSIQIRYEARLVANGRIQQFRVDCNETFILALKPATIRTVLSLALSRNWPIHQLDVKNAFLNGDLFETVYMYQPPDGDLVFDPTLYRSFAGGLQYLTFTRPDISYAVQHVCLHMHDPQEPHFAALKQVLHYVRGTLDFGLQLYALSTGSLVAYSDADWAGCPTARSSTSGYCVLL
nr:ribonuclease H-like domain-containing protein [Tanacetum cinerariifolium]